MEIRILRFSSTDLERIWRHRRSFCRKDEGTVIYTTVQEGYKEGIEWLHKLVDRRLVDPEAFTQEWSTYVAKGKESPLWSLLHLGYCKY